jgi:2-keto-4-pentenoate hydratase
MMEYMAQDSTTYTEPTQIAAAFLAARREHRSLDAFPGIIPSSLDQAYHIQDQAIRDWPDTIKGWKVGRILGDLALQHNTDRLIGPIFASSIYQARLGEVIEFDAIKGGFCAVEGEYVFKLAKDATSNRTDYDAASALELIEGLWTGIEIAGSPLATINALGPTVVVSDFGNNLGLILGQPVANWQQSLHDLSAIVEIDDRLVGTGNVSAFPGGILGLCSELCGQTRLAAKAKYANLNRSCYRCS